MKIVDSLPTDRESNSSFILSIGNFDGVHIGHQKVLERIKEVAQKHAAQSCVVTFSNHPSTILRPFPPTLLLCTLEHKIELLRSAGIDLLILLQFTKELSEQTAEQFLRKLQSAVPFNRLILGSDATIGKNREGDRAQVSSIASPLRFNVEYVEDLTIDFKRVSSSQIRTLIQQGNFSEAEKFLGRPFSVYAKVIRGYNKGASLGFPTVNIPVEGLCLPPLGVYSVFLRHGLQTYPGIANLGVAPTLRQAANPLLEVHLFNQTVNLYDEFVDVRFQTYIRPEQKFESIEDLKAQIAKDIIQAKNSTEFGGQNKNKVASSR